MSDEIDEFGRVRRRPRDASPSPPRDAHHRGREADFHSMRGRDDYDDRARFRSERGGHKRSPSPTREPSPSSKRRRYDEWDRRDFRGEGDYNRRNDFRNGNQGGVGGGYDNFRQPPRRRVNPEDLYIGNLKTKRQFADYFEDLSNSEIDAKYEEYRSEWRRRQGRKFFDQHQTDEWFKEKYSPVVLEAKYAERTEKAKENVRLIKEQLLNNTLDSNMVATETEESTTKVEPEKIEEQAHNEEGSKEVTETTETEKEKEPEKEKENKKELVDENDGLTLFIKPLPANISRSDLLDFLNKKGGLQRLSLAEPKEQQNWSRFGWATYKSKEQAQNALTELNGKKIRDVEIGLAPNKRGKDQSKTKITPPIASEPARISIDLKLAKQLALVLDKDKQLEEENVILKDSQFSKLSEQEQLDRLIYYLRFVHLFCYYCGEEFDDEDELLRRCGKKHLRRTFRSPTDQIPKPDVSKDAWCVSLDFKLKARIDGPSKADVWTAKQRWEKKMERLYKEKIKIEDEKKFKCLFPNCDKKFAGENFIRKHISLKHQDVADELKREAIGEQYFENYLLDPRRPAPNEPQHPRDTPTQRKNFSPQGFDRQQIDHNHNNNNPNNNFQTTQSPRQHNNINNNNNFNNNNNNNNRGGFRGPTPTRGRPQGRPSLEALQEAQRDMSPPPGVSLDPRAARGSIKYLDLDAPKQEEVVIDYRMDF